jgi:hypothetical protein
MFFDWTQNLVKQAEEMASAVFENAVNEDLEPVKPKGKSFREEFEMDLKSGAYEKMFVPEFERGRSSKFIHDFQAVSITSMSGYTYLVELSNHEFICVEAEPFTTSMDITALLNACCAINFQLSSRG